MDCGACGKPLSLTAKFCGKCGAPVKRTASQPETDTSTPSLLDTNTTPAPFAQDTLQAVEPPVDDLVLTLDIPQASPEHAAMLNIDLDLVVNEKTHHQPTTPQVPAIDLPEPDAQNVPVKPVASTEPATTPPSHSSPLPESWLKEWQAANQMVQEKLEKHSQLLDALVLNTQLPSPPVAQPDHLTPLINELLERQKQLANQISALEQTTPTSSEPVVLKLPDEFKLQLEKQKIELLKAFSQNIAQNSSNIETANQETLVRIEALMAENTAATQTLEIHLAPISQSVSDLKARMQAISKKVDEVATKPVKAGQAKNDENSDSSSFIIFVIGLLCGLTVVLSSLAIYNFLSREPAASAKADVAAPAENGHEKNAHDAPAAAHEEPAAHPSASHDEPAHGAASGHDKPASDSSKAKSH